ncbi:MAG: hypothetical protein N2691_04885 [Patescibacteria group bacterium]|nr:hypothetical protein [Patescibacteria group bacterium]
MDFPKKPSYRNLLFIAKGSFFLLALVLVSVLGFIATVGREKIYRADIDYLRSLYDGPAAEISQKEFLDRIAGDSAIFQSGAAAGYISLTNDFFDALNKNYLLRQQKIQEDDQSAMDALHMSEQATLSNTAGCQLVQAPFGRVFDECTLESMSGTSVTLLSRSSTGSFTRFSDRVTNPQVTEADGAFTFYAPDGIYRLEAVRRYASENPVTFISQFQETDRSGNPCRIDAKVSHPRATVLLIGKTSGGLEAIKYPVTLAGDAFSKLLWGSLDLLGSLIVVQAATDPSRAVIGLDPVLASVAGVVVNVPSQVKSVMSTSRFLVINPENSSRMIAGKTAAVIPQNVLGTTIILEGRLPEWVAYVISAGLILLVMVAATVVISYNKVRKIKR